MKLAVYQRPTSSAQNHVIAVTLGEGDIREYSVNDAQHLFESLGMALQDYLEYVNREKSEI